MAYTEVMDEVASASQIRVALLLSALLVGLTAAALPFAAVQLPALPHIAGIYGASVAMIDLATFGLLISTPNRLRSHTVIAAAYLFSSLMAAFHVLSFPGAVLERVAVIGSPNAASWLYIVWRSGFAFFILWAVLIDGAPDGKTKSGDRLPVSLAVSLALLAFALSQMTDSAAVHRAGGRESFSNFSLYGSYVSAGLAGIASLLIGWRDLHRRVIFVWLVFVLIAEATAVWFSTFSGGRYTLAWYAARVEGVVANAVVLVLLVTHFRALQRSLFESVEALKARTDELQAQMHKRESAEVELGRARRLEALGRLGAGVSHDLNNILQVITGRLTLLQRKAGDVVGQDVEVIRRNVKKAEAMTRQLTLLSGRRQSRAEPLMLQTALPDAAANATQLISALHRIELSIEHSLPQVAVDPLELEIAITNLVTNARDAMPEGGVIKVGACAPPAVAGDDHGHVVLTVSDEGTGIKPELLDRLFEPFFTTKSAGKGTGLGLTQVYGFAKASGGDVTVRSVVGRGTVVSLRLPIPTAPTQRDLETVTDSNEVSIAPRVVLLVDDNDDVRESSQQMLSAAGFVVRSACNATEALEHLFQGLVADILVSDIVMPSGPHGVELAKRVRLLLPNITVVLVTGYSDMAEDASREDFAVLRKPYDLASLLAILNTR